MEREKCKMINEKRTQSMNSRLRSKLLSLFFLSTELEMYQSTKLFYLAFFQVVLEI